MRRVLAAILRALADWLDAPPPPNPNVEAEHAVQHVEDQPVPGRATVDQRLRDGTF